jgi:hypothetical protein
MSRGGAAALQSVEHGSSVRPSGSFVSALPHAVSSCVWVKFLEARRLAPLRSASNRMTLLRSALPRLAPCRLAMLRLATNRIAPLRSALSRLAPCRLAPNRLAPLRSALLRASRC